LVTKLQDLINGGRMGRSTAATHGDADLTKPLTHRGPGNAQLGTDLAQSPTLGVQVGCTLNIHGATVTRKRIRLHRGALDTPSQLQKCPGEYLRLAAVQVT
jgi:hypothetical protein